MAIALFTMNAVNAQIGDQIKQSRDRAAKLEKLTTDYKSSGIGQIDGYGNDIKAAAIFAMENSVKLENLYKREIGEVVDGVQDVTVTKPNFEDWESLALSVAKEAKSIKDAVDKAKDAADAAKKEADNVASEKNPMKKAKAAKNAKAAAAVIEFGNAATPILLEESAAQVKAIDEIMKTLKAGKNL